MDTWYFGWTEPVVDTIHPQSNKFAKGMKIKAAGELNLNDSAEQRDTFSFLFYFASLSRIKNISTISKGDQKYDKQWDRKSVV